MLERIRRIVRKNSFIFNSYLTFMVFRNLRVKDFLDFKKIILFWKVAPYTMTSSRRLSHIYDIVKMFEQRKIGGAFVECGTWKGGTAGIIADVVSKAGSSREIWLFDSFEGLPNPTDQDGRSNHSINLNNERASLDDINFLLFNKLRLSRDNVRIYKGWFQDTLPRAKEKMESIAVLRLDCDLYESNKCCLEHLYEKVISGGYIVINTYDSWKGTKKAVDEFLFQNSIKAQLKKIDYGGRYFQKP